MNSISKFTFNLLIGINVAMLCACDNNESKAAGKTSALPVEKVNENILKNLSTAEDNTIQPQTESVLEPLDEKRNITPQDLSLSNKKIQASNAFNTANNGKKMQMRSIEKTVHHQQPNDEKQALLHILQKQYEQVRCSATGEKLGVNSFCHQEERRLFLEIQRVKDSI